MSKSGLEILEIITLVIIAIFGISGNLLIIFLFAFGGSAVKVFRNYFIVSLTFADLMIAGILVPFWTVGRMNFYSISENIWSIFAAYDILCGSASILNLTAISLERLYAIRYPFLHLTLTQFSYRLAIAVTWFIGFMLSGAKIIVAFGYKSRIKQFSLSVFILAYMVPILVIAMSYSVIFYYATSRATDYCRANRFKRELKAVKTIAIIVGLFILCWTPFFVLNMIHDYCKNCDLRKNFIGWIYASKVLHYSNSMMNFFVYGYRSPDFRRLFRDLLIKKLKLNR
ncbi:probable G-protein coupled receptor No9 [Hydra vulgaris]|uniref:Probable G-protein coupled receptor No9 n=1 Tax=Hydra vulgaris TaxID=6087 RepID=A0ABM4DBX7_HYDVU